MSRLSSREPCLREENGVDGLRFRNIMDFFLRSPVCRVSLTVVIVLFLGDSVWPCCSAFLYAAGCLPYTARKVWFVAKS